MLSDWWLRILVGVKWPPSGKIAVSPPLLSDQMVIMSSYKLCNVLSDSIHIYKLHSHLIPF